MIKYSIIYVLIFLINSCVYFDYALLKENSPSNYIMKKNIEFDSLLFNNQEQIPGLRISIKHLEKPWDERKNNGDNWNSFIIIEYENAIKDIKISISNRTLYHKKMNEYIPATKHLTFWNTEENYIFNKSENIEQELFLDSEISRHFISINNTYVIDSPPNELLEHIELKISFDDEELLLNYDFPINYTKHYSIIDVWMSI